jgi:uncharacterized protein (PEP-CTERM system associated)
VNGEGILSTISRPFWSGWALGGACVALFAVCSGTALAQIQPETPGTAAALPIAPAAAPPPPQAWRIEPYLRTTVTATDNSDLSTAGTVPKDVIFDIEPRLVVKGRGANYRLDADVTAHALFYTNDPEDNRFFPVGTVALNANLLDRWIYLDASVSADQIATDPYAFRTDIDTGRNQINTLGYRISPYLQHEFTPSLSLQARSDNYWTKRRGTFAAADPRRNSLFEKQSVLLEKRPLPFGFSAEASQEVTSYRSGVSETVLKIDSARAVASYAVDPTFVISAVGGVEKSVYALTTSTDNIAGARFTWNATERSELKGSYERRFFGNGGSLEWNHRSPFIGVSISAAREPTATGSSFVLQTGGLSIESLLDAIFTTRYPDPAQRAVVVSSVVAGLGIPNVLGEPLEVFSDYAQVRDSFNASIIFQGIRTTLITRFYIVRLRQLSNDSATFVPLITIAFDNVQKGVSADYTQKLSRTFSANVSAGYANIEGLGLAAGQTTSNQNVRLTLTQELSPDTKISYGIRHQVDRVTSAGLQRKAQEIATFIGLIHRF